MAEKVTKRPSEDKTAKTKRTSSAARKSPAAEAHVPEKPAAAPVSKPVMATVDLLEPKKKVKRVEGSRKPPLKPFVVPIGVTGILPPSAADKNVEPPVLHAPPGKPPENLLRKRKFCTLSHRSSLRILPSNWG